MNVGPKNRETQVPRNRGTKLESGGPAQGPQRGQGRRSQPRREEGRSAQPPPFSLSPSLAPLNSLLLSPGFSSRSRGPLLPARLNSSSTRGARAASGGGAKCRRFLAPGEPSPLPGSGKDARRGGKPACGRQARTGRQAGGPSGAKAKRGPQSLRPARCAAAAGAGRSANPPGPGPGAHARARGRGRCGGSGFTSLPGPWDRVAVRMRAGPA